MQIVEKTIFEIVCQNNSELSKIGFPESVLKSVIRQTEQYIYVNDTFVITNDFTLIYNFV